MRAPGAIRRAAGAGLAALLFALAAQGASAAPIGGCIPLDNGACWKPEPIVFHMPNGFHYVEQSYGGVDLYGNGDVAIHVTANEVSRNGDVNVPVWIAEAIYHAAYGELVRPIPYPSSESALHRILQPADAYTTIDGIGPASPPPFDAGMQPILTAGRGIPERSYSRNSRVNLLDCVTTGRSGSLSCKMRNLAPNQVEALKRYDASGKPIAGDLYVNVAFKYNLISHTWRGVSWFYRWWPTGDDGVRLPPPQVGNPTPPQNPGPSNPTPPQNQGPGGNPGGGGMPPDCDLNNPAIWQKVLTDPAYFQIHCVRPQLVR